MLLQDALLCNCEVEGGKERERAGVRSNEMTIEIRVRHKLKNFWAMHGRSATAAEGEGTKVFWRATLMFVFACPWIGARPQEMDFLFITLIIGFFNSN